MDIKIKIGQNDYSIDPEKAVPTFSFLRGRKFTVTSEKDSKQLSLNEILANLNPDSLKNPKIRESLISLREKGYDKLEDEPLFTRIFTLLKHVLSGITFDKLMGQFPEIKSEEKPKSQPDVKNNKDEAKVTKTFEMLVKSKESLDADDTFLLGKLYQKKGTLEDLKNAAQCFEKAAKLNHPESQNALGRLFEKGEGVEKNELKAVEYYILAAKGENVNALYNLACCYKDGIGVDKNESTSISYFDLAANKGHPAAQNALGFLYEKGEGVNRDKAEALKLYQKAAESKYPQALYNLGRMSAKGMGGIEKNEETAFKLYKEAAELGNPYAIDALCGCYLKGLGTPQSDKEFKLWFAKVNPKTFPEGIHSTKLAFQTEEGVSIEVLQGDLFKQKVDAIVNPANTGLNGGGGVDALMEKACGKSIYAECQKQLKEKNVTCKTGDAFITGSGNLKDKTPIKHVIHTVGPTGGAKDRKILLRDAYYNSLLRAHETKLTSIAFPAISIGIFGYPAEEASEVAIGAIKEFSKNNPGTSLTTIRLTYWGDDVGIKAYKHIDKTGLENFS